MKEIHGEHPDRSREIIGQWYAQYRDKIYVLLKSTVKNSDIAEDLLQEVFVEATKKFDELENHPNPGGWLYVTARYKAQEYFRKIQRRSEIDIEAEGLYVADKDSGYLRTEMELVIEQELSEEEKMRFRRYFITGYTIEEMAILEQISENNAKVRITRLRAKLKKLLHISAYLLMCVPELCNTWIS